MAPLIEVAWADGRVTARESDVLVEIADYYGLTGYEDSFCEFLDAMITRGSVTDSTRNWFRLRKMLTELPSAAFEKVAEALTIQARFMAEQGSNNLISIIRGDGFGRDEESVLCRLADELRAIGIAIAEKQASLEATAAPISRNVVGWNEIGTLALPLIVNPRMEDTVAAAG